MADAINPTHYQRNGAQLIDSIEHLPGNRFNAAKYTVRAGEKDPDTLVEDLDKALWYQLREFYRLGVINFNPAETGAKDRLRTFLGWHGTEPAAYTDGWGDLDDANVVPIRRVPRVWDSLEDIPRDIAVVDEDNDRTEFRDGRWQYQEGRVWFDALDTHAPYTEVIA